MITPIYEPFVGLTYDGVHSSTLGLYRVSDGSRYNEDLLPSFSDKTSERTGADGMYFFGSNYQQKNWTIEFAFDYVTKEQLLQIKQLFGAGVKKPKMLVFDEDRDWSSLVGSTTSNEEPSIQKYYLVKVAEPPQLKTLCFDELDDNGNIVDIYKGELTIEFTSYSPFGYGKTKYFKYTGAITTELNMGDQEVFPKVFIFRDNPISVETKIDFYFDINSIEVEDLENDSIYSDKSIYIKDLEIPSGRYGVVLDFEKGVIYGLTSKPNFYTNNNLIHTTINNISYNIDNIVYNNFIESGYFFKIPNNSQVKYNITTNDDFYTVISLREIKY